ncbi:YbaB/EbfC family nucleoid-associated protein [Micromonospora sp. CPCC 205539]|uniref:YbaB/EbfC family nucleoid-associated protein n=1 Tax=Micromonospora sp. CPCC 205539 TaxID=3122408 RepID=UPI002FEFE00A
MSAGLAGDGGGLLDPDSARERLSAWQGRIGKLAADTKAMSDRLEHLRVTASDGNRLVEVTIDSAGALVDLRLGQQTQRLAPDVVARTIMATIRAAKEELADRSQEIIAETVGTESAAAREIAERVGQQLRGPDPGAETGDDSRSWR